MPFLLFGVGALFAALFLLNNLLKTLARRARIGFLDLLLAFAATLIPLSALVFNYAGDLASTGVMLTPDPLIDRAILILSGAIGGVSLLIMLIEIFRPERLKGSRGILGIFSGILLALTAFVVPFIAIYFTLNADLDANADDGGTPVALIGAETTADALSIDAIPTASGISDQGAQLFRAIREVLSDEIELDEVSLFTQLDAGTPLANIVTDNGGDVERVIARLSDILSEGIEAAVQRDEINTLQAALVLSQMDTFVRIAVNSDLNSLGGRFGGPTPTGTRRSLLSLLTATPGSIVGAITEPTSEAGQMTATVAPDANVVIDPVVNPLPSTNTPRPTRTRASTGATAVPISPTPDSPVAPLTPETTAPITPDPSSTRGSTATLDNAPVATSSPTRFVYQTRTPTATPTEVTPCVASVENNLRLRAAPSADAETLVVIPYASSILLYARSSDSAWWQTDYDGQTGWVDGNFLMLSAACAALPTR